MFTMGQMMWVNARTVSVLTATQLAAIMTAMDRAKKVKGKPTMINIRTIIGLGSQHQNTGKAHGAALGEDDVSYVKTQLGFHPDAKFVVPPQVYEYFEECRQRGVRYEQEWDEMMTRYSASFPTEHAELKRRIEGKLRVGWESDLPAKDKLSKDPAPTRKSSGIVVESLVPKDQTFNAGSADLLESTFVSFSGMTEFQNVSTGTDFYDEWGLTVLCSSLRAERGIMPVDKSATG